MDNTQPNKLSIDQRLENLMKVLAERLPEMAPVMRAQIVPTNRVFEKYTIRGRIIALLLRDLEAKLPGMLTAAQTAWEAAGRAAEFKKEFLTARDRPQCYFDYVFSKVKDMAFQGRNVSPTAPIEGAQIIHLEEWQWEDLTHVLENGLWLATRLKPKAVHGVCECGNPKTAAHHRQCPECFEATLGDRPPKADKPAPAPADGMFGSKTTSNRHNYRRNGNVPANSRYVKNDPKPQSVTQGATFVLAGAVTVYLKPLADAFNASYVDSATTIAPNGLILTGPALDIMQDGLVTIGDFELLVLGKEITEIDDVAARNRAAKKTTPVPA